MADLREKAVAAARRAKPQVLDTKALYGGDVAEEKYGESEFKARQKMAELKLQEERNTDQAKQRAQAEWETTADRGIAAKRNIYGAAGTMKDAIKDKLTYPTDIVQEARSAQEYGGSKRGRGDKKVEDIEGPSARERGHLIV